MTYTIRQFQKSDTKMIWKFHKLSFNSKYTQNYFKAKYSTECFFDKYIGFFAVDSIDNEGAYYGAFPIKVLFKNKELVAAQSGDTMTLVDHRGKGLFTKLARYTFEYAAEVGVAFIFGFPNNNSLPGFKKMGWVFPGSWIKYTVKNIGVDFSLLYRILSKLGVNISKIIESRLNKYRVDFDEITWEQFLPDEVEGCVIKDKIFFKYKTYSSGMLLEIDNFYLHLKFTPNALIIGDVSYFNINRVQDFTMALKKLSSQVFLNNSYLYVSKNHWLNQYLEKESIKGEITETKIGFYNTSDQYYDFSKFMVSYIDADFY